MNNFKEIILELILPILLCTTLLFGSIILGLKLADILAYGFDHREYFETHVISYD